MQVVSSDGCGTSPPHLSPHRQDHVRSLAALTANVKRHGAPFRHMLFYGGCTCCSTVAALAGNAVC